jgi:hypothetical protein
MRVSALPISIYKEISIKIGQVNANNEGGFFFPLA